MGIQRDKNFSFRLQQIAIREIYSRVWPDAKIIELDDDNTHPLKKVLDIGGCDKLILYSDDRIDFLGQRFRRHKYRKYHDLTLRAQRGNYRSEIFKALKAIEDGGFVSGYYAYGVANERQTGFEWIEVIKWPHYLKGVLGKQIRLYGPIDNHDGITSFFYTPFNEIPDDLIVYSSTNPGTQLKLL